MTLRELVLADDNIVYATDISSVVDYNISAYHNVQGHIDAIKELGDLFLNAQVVLIEPSSDDMLNIWVLVS